MLERVCTAMDWGVDDSPCPEIDGLKAEGKATVQKTDDALVDGIIENLILSARAMRRDDVVDLLRQNLTSEEAALRKVMTTQEQVVTKALERTAPYRGPPGPWPGTLPGHGRKSHLGSQPWDTR